MAGDRSFSNNRYQITTSVLGANNNQIFYKTLSTRYTVVNGVTGEKVISFSNYAGIVANNIPNPGYFIESLKPYKTEIYNDPNYPDSQKSIFDTVDWEYVPIQYGWNFNWTIRNLKANIDGCKDTFKQQETWWRIRNSKIWCKTLKHLIDNGGYSAYPKKKNVNNLAVLMENLELEGAVAGYSFDDIDNQLNQITEWWP